MLAQLAYACITPTYACNKGKIYIFFDILWYKIKLICYLNSWCNVYMKCYNILVYTCIKSLWLIYFYYIVNLKYHFKTEWQIKL